MVEICKEKNIYFEQVLHSLMLSLPVNQPLVSKYFSDNKAFDKLLECTIHSKLTDNYLDSLLAVIMNAFSFILRLTLYNGSICLGKSFFI